MSYHFHIADVFTDTPFGGNQLGILPDARGLSTPEMARIAREFNFSETIFVFPPDDAQNTRKVRIFTPGSELPFAGHPTVGVAYVLALTEEIKLDGDQTRIVLEEGVGPVSVVISARAGKPYFAQLTAAMLPQIGPESNDAETVASVLSLAPEDLYLENGYAIEPVSAGVPYLLIPLRTRDALERARINVAAWEKSLKGKWASEVFLFVEDEDSKARNGAQLGDGVIRARMFAPTLGITEDPATGSACASLAGYLAWRSSVRDGTLRFTIHQGVEMGRPSLIATEADVSDGKVTAVRVGGTAVLIASGTLHVP